MIRLNSKNYLNRMKGERIIVHITYVKSVLLFPFRQTTREERSTVLIFSLAFSLDSKEYHHFIDTNMAKKKNRIQQQEQLGVRFLVSSIDASCPQSRQIDDNNNNITIIRFPKR